jgi:hypothetical protein
MQRRRGLLWLAAALTAIASGWPMVVKADNMATAGYFRQDPITTTVPATPSVPNLPMYCAVAVESDGGAPGQSLNASGYLACGNVPDSATYSWTWTDDRNGATLLQQSGTLYTTPDAATKTAAAVGVAGQRKVVLCWSTSKAGYYPASDCRALDHV